MTLLDQLNANKDLRKINCCNELEAGYAADGYARAKGKLACTFNIHNTENIFAACMTVQPVQEWVVWP